MNNLVQHLAAALLLSATLAPLSFAQVTDEDKSIEQRREEARIERLWNLNWRTFTTSFLEHDGRFIPVPGYERSKPSSIGQSISDYRSESQWTQTFEDDRGKETTRKLTKPEEEAFAAVALIPKVEVGQYGYIHSGEIDKIIDDKTLELQDIWLVDAEAVRSEKQNVRKELWGEVLEDIEDAIRNRRDRRANRTSRRLAENEAVDWAYAVREAAAERQRDPAFSRYTWVVQGFATGKLKEDARWPSANAREPGLQLIVVEVKDRTVTAVPAAALRKGITELQFIDYLQSRDMNKADFVELVTQAKREHRADYVAHVLAALTGNTPPNADNDNNNEVELAD